MYALRNFLHSFSAYYMSTHYDEDLLLIQKGYFMRIVCMKYLFPLFHFSFFLLSSLSANPLQTAKELEISNNYIKNISKEIESLYTLNDNEKWRDITAEVLASADTPAENKQCILLHKRRIIVFKYPSDGLWIKAFISYTPSPTFRPMLLLYRGGNESFGLLNPGIIYAIWGYYTVVSSTLRGGVSEGKDEFGGQDVNDIKNLVDFIPTISRELNIQLQPPCVFMLGLSRGGLEMFLTLAKFPELQNRVNKVVALSSILDLHHMLQERSQDMKDMLTQHFGLQEGKKGEAWIAARDPLNTVPSIKKSLPVLIVQGTADIRVDLEEGHRMTETLKKNGNAVQYWEIANGSHVLMNNPYIMNNITRWLESNSACVSIHIPKAKE